MCGRMWPNSGPYFNSRPREGANALPPWALAPFLISIPAPARGRTDGRTVQLPLIAISIPAPARGRTYSAGRYPPAAYFNSRPREGANNVYPAGISCAVVFQFPPPRGGERTSNPPISRPSYFNSRPREGANISKAAMNWLGTHFNSRPREGANIAAILFGSALALFQFPPPRGGEPPVEGRKKS